MLAAYWSGAGWAFRISVWVYLGALALDFVAGVDESPMWDGFSTRPFRVITWLWVPLQAALVFTGLLAVRGADLGTIYVASIGVGMIGGMFGIPVAHELMHRDTAFERVLAEVEMTLFGYTHFCIEHVEGHHANVGLRHDPATARYGESLYAFLPRSVVGGYIDAWRLDAKRMLRYLLVLCAVVVAIALGFGWRGVVFFAAQSAVAIMVIEAINYVEHYGLVRQESEPVTARHSWNSGHRVSNWLLFNVPRHSDHHDDAARPYPLLRHAGEARQLPAGYFAMFVLALFPPLWTAIMHPLLALDE
jgi:alkane 1-monooxygenase